MKIDLAAMTKRARPTRRKEITLRPVRTPATLATDLYQQVYAPVLTAWNEAIPALMAEYERTLAQITTDSPADVRITLERNEGVVAQILLALRQRLTRWAQRAEAQHRQRWTASVLTATGVNLSTVIGPEAARMTLETVVERNVELVSNVSAQARQRIADAVFRGFTTRAPAADVARELREAIAMGRRRGRNIAADQTGKLASALDQERRREAGIDKYRWIHSGAAHPREEHLERDGELFSDDDPPDDGPPGTAINCGCTSAAVLELD